MVLSEKQKKILSILSDGEFHSGTEIADSLEISRSAVWKQLVFLEELRLGHSAVSGKGYRLDRPLELLDYNMIYRAVDDETRAMISSLEIHDRIHSTNSYLTVLSNQNAPSGFVCFAEYQTSGKGRRGRIWVSPYGNNIYLSVLWRFQLAPAAISGLSLAVGVAVIKALMQHDVDNIGLKWPNDIYSQGKKLGGILIEVSGENDGPCSAVIGLGINLDLSESEAGSIAQAWTDLSKITGRKRLYRNELAGMLLNHLFKVLDSFERFGLGHYINEWRTFDCLVDQPAVLFISDQSVEGIVRGVDDNGLLLLELRDGKIQAFASGEVTFKRSFS